MNESTLGDRFIGWAEKDASIAAVILIGSRSRPTQAPGTGDRYSDWDFQVVASKPQRFDTAAWVGDAGLGTPIAYVVRRGRLGSAQKATLLLPDGEIDLVVIPLQPLLILRLVHRLGLSRRVNRARVAAADLAAVLRGGYRFLKGESEWGIFFAKVASSGPSDHLSDDDIRKYADGFVCDYLSTLRKVERGELLAGQRWLHHHLAEANFRLLQELQRRKNAASFPDARRLEMTCESSLVDAVRIDCAPTEQSLRAALTKSAATCRSLVRELIGNTWHWPASIT